MDQTLQSLLVLAIVAGAALFVGARWYRTFASLRRKKNDPGCGGDCGCGPDR